MTAVKASTRLVSTPVGDARIHRWRPDDPTGTLILGHGAGGRAWSADLLALTALAESDWDVILLEQPWRVAGRGVASPPAQLDVAWRAVMASLTRRSTTLAAGPLVVGGRSAGARVACRTSTDPDPVRRPGAGPRRRPVGVLALAFPLHPPGKPEASRVDELAGPIDAGLDVLVVQGRTDPFGSPAEIAAALSPRALQVVHIVEVPGAHGFDAKASGVLPAVEPWLEALRQEAS